MGAIQQSINNALAATAVAGRMIGHQKESDIAAGERAAKDLPDLQEQEEAIGKELTPAYQQIVDREKDFKDAKTMLKGANTTRDKVAGMQLAREAKNDLTMAKEAFKRLIEKQTAITATRQRAEAQIAKGRKWGGSY